MSAKHMVVLVSVLALLLTSACGSAQVDIHTNIKSPDVIEQTVAVKATGMIGGAIRQGFRVDDMRAQGWRVEEKIEGESYAMTAVQTFDRGNARKIMVGPSGENAENEFTVTEELFSREYRIRMKLPGSATPTPSPSTAKPDPQMDAMAKQMLSTALVMRWKVTTPGEIVETNADSRDGKSATWVFNVDSLGAGREMVLVAREQKSLLSVLWPVLVALVVVAGIGGGVVVVGRRRRTGANGRTGISA